MAAPDRITPARAAAYAVLRRVFEQGAYADRALRTEAEGLEPRDRALATQLAFGAVQRAGTLDYLIGRAANRAADTLDAPLLAALRLGAFQLLFLDRVPAHAAVDASVELTKRDAPKAAGLANAVLRRLGREGATALASLDDRTPATAATKHSVPVWLAELWFAERGPDEARALLAASNEPAEHALRANTLRTTTAALAEALPVATHAGTLASDALIAGAAFDAHGSPLFAEGAFTPQSQASQLVAETLDPQPGERVLDLCAAPGAKTTHLAALMGNEGTLLAVERNAQRAEALRATCARMGASIVEVVTADAATFTSAEPFDRVLVDPPCSGLGTLRSRPDLRWRAKLDHELVALQAAILAAGLRATKPGGRLVYSTCTLSRRENEGQVAALPVTATRTTLPHIDGTDGFFLATIERASG